ncbi:MAG: RT0821/Lpp0805 family surface protein [Ancalomicrobiaceae bacterium]|nr:RT0821/Lpp0805 family surface protein [Ancalomicrobiaceae bacterium]
MAVAEVSLAGCLSRVVSGPSVGRQEGGGGGLVGWLSCSLLAFGLAGCGNIHLFSGDVTGATVQTGILSYAGSDHSDWDIIRAAVAKAPETPLEARIAWQNTSTGDTGTISDIAKATREPGSNCRAFSSTIVSVDGVRLYSAEICRSVMDTWEFAKIEPADSQKTAQQ